MPGLLKAFQAFGVHVQQRAGLRPLKAPKRLALPARPAREVVTVKDLPDRRAGPAEQAREATRPQIRASAGIANAALLELVKAPRRASRARAAISRPCPRSASRRVGRTPAMPPAMRRGERDSTLFSRGPKRAPSLNQLNQSQPSSRSDLRVSVNTHPGPPVLASWRTPRDSGRARTSPQPFTTSAGSSARAA